jgi:predicted dinucleotide-binding enzyme
MERLQQAFSSARFVKAFNSVGNASMVNPHSVEARRRCSSAGNGRGEAVVAGLLRTFGWGAG